MEEDSETSAGWRYGRLGMSLWVVLNEVEIRKDDGGCLERRASVVRDERCGISQRAVGACPSWGSAKGCRSTTWLLEGLDVETCPSLRTSVRPASTAFCETLLQNGLNIRIRFFYRIIDKVL